VPADVPDRLAGRQRRQRGLQPNPVLARNARASVRSLAPTTRPQSARVRPSAGSTAILSATSLARSSDGIRMSIVVIATGLSRSTSTASACARTSASRSGRSR